MASFLYVLSDDDEKYTKYLSHKYEKKIENFNLISELKTRQLHIGGKVDIMFKLEENICQHIWNSLYQRVPNYGRMASVMDYNCVTKPKHPKMMNKVVHAEDWSALMASGRCEAKLLNKLLNANKAYTKEEYKILLEKQFNSNECQILFD